MNKKLLAALVFVGLTAMSSGAMKPVTIIDQGSFMVGGKTMTAPGTYVDNEPINFAGETLHGDAAYVAYQVPKNINTMVLYFCTAMGNLVNHGKQLQTVEMGSKIFS